MNNPTENITTETIEHYDAMDRFERQSKPGVLVASAFLFCISLFMLSQLDTQTKSFSSLKLPLQPRFWPSVVLTAMSFFSGMALLLNIIKHRQDATQKLQSVLSELNVWTRPIEYAVWFIVYAWSVPYIGYLPTTIIFMLLLGYRVGIKRPATFGILTVIGIGTVLLFKAGLSVNMPAGMIYDLAPESIRNILIRNF
ncbi:MAG: tripartite tricarboxylate transporter TctB family protein [Rhodospirillales bacterium]|jgi:hypothetical protein|nr:tripartite tricarboxylate transporter TctB family protein [Rhodospirillales bacterium]